MFSGQCWYGYVTNDLICVGALIEGNNNSRALELLSSFDTKVATVGTALDNGLIEEYRTIVIFLRGCCHQGLKDEEAAHKHFDVCIVLVLNFNL